MSPLSPVEVDYLDSLLYAKSLLGSAGIRDLVVQVKIDQGPSSHQDLAKFQLIPVPFKPSRLEITSHISPFLPKIERVEMNLSIISRAYWWLILGRDGERDPSRKQMCKGLGCFSGSHNRPELRWRYLDYEGDSPKFLELESRPVCKLCQTIVATQAGAWSGGEPNSGNYRPDAHQECLRYAKRVVAPAIRAYRATESG